jgi:hypothetical protein
MEEEDPLDPNLHSAQQSPSNGCDAGKPYQDAKGDKQEQFQHSRGSSFSVVQSDSECKRDSLPENAAFINPRKSAEQERFIVSPL